MNNITSAAFATIEKSLGLNAGGRNIAEIETPACALFHEAWQTKFGVFPNAAGKKVKVTALDGKQQPTGKSVVCELQDTLPHEANAGESKIELNLPAFKELGAKAGVLVSFEFVEEPAQ